DVHVRLGCDLTRDREVVVIGSVDDSVRLGRPVADDVEVVEVAQERRGADGLQRLDPLNGADETGDLMAGLQQLPDDGAADEPGRAGDENLHRLHGWNLQSSLMTATDITIY